MTGVAESISGQAAGVPFVALPPAGGPRASAPVVIAWHLLDPPRTEAAFAAQVPLRGLDAWRIYLGLPLSGSRLPAGGWDELMRLAHEDAVLNLHRPIVYGAAEELGPALVDLRRRLGIDSGPMGVMGGSAGAAVAQLVLAEAGLEIAAAVLINPLVRLRQVVDVISRRFGVSYPWSDESSAVADRLDFVARAGESGDDDRRAAVLLVVGEQDDACFREPAADLVAALRRSEAASPAGLVTVPGMAHPLTDEPGIEPAPQSPQAAVVDGLAVRWFQRYLSLPGG
jgi:dienelactone hydrolase